MLTTSHPYKLLNVPEIGPKSFETFEEHMPGSNQKALFKEIILKHVLTYSEQLEGIFNLFRSHAKLVVMSYSPKDGEFPLSDTGCQRAVPFYGAVSVLIIGLKFGAFGIERVIFCCAKVKIVSDG